MAHRFDIPTVLQLISGRTDNVRDDAVKAAEDGDFSGLSFIVRIVLGLPSEVAFAHDQISDLSIELRAMAPSLKYPPCGYFQSLDELKAHFPDEDGGVCVVGTSEHGGVSVAYFNGNHDRGYVANFVTSMVYVNEWTLSIRSVKY